MFPVFESPIAFSIRPTHPFTHPATPNYQIRHIDSDLRRFERHYGFIPPILQQQQQQAAAGAGGAQGGKGAGKHGHAAGGGGHARRHSGAGGVGVGVLGGDALLGAAADGAAVAGGAAAAALVGGTAMNPGGIDPNEPVYCFCRQVAYGEMIGCDNPACEYEWFHYRCVGLTRQPTAGNRWLCPRCKRLEALPQHKKAAVVGGAGVSSSAVLEGLLGGGGEGVVEEKSKHK